MYLFLTQSVWADRIGWMLIHSLWQFIIVAMLVLVLQWALRRTSAVTRYRTLLIAMCIMVVMPIATCFLMNFDSSPTVAVHRHAAEQPNNQQKTPPLQPTSPPLPPQEEGVTTDTETARTTTTAEGPIAHPVVELQPEEPPHLEAPQAASSLSSFYLEKYIQSWLPTIVLIWLAGVFVAAMRPLLSWRMLHRLRTRYVLPVEDNVHTMLQRTAKRLKFARSVEVLQSTLAKTPMVVGYFRPVILLPVSVLTNLPESQLELILAHELAHIRRHDYLVNLLQTLAETLFFYHPAMWWLSRQIRNEREHCCDDVAMTSMGNRFEYGKALLAVVELRETTTTLSLAASGGSLLQRMRRITGCEQGPRIVSGGSILCLLLVLTAIFAVGTWAADPQTDPSSMTAEAFSKLSGDKQRTVLVEAFGKHLDQGKNLFYETEQISQSFDTKDGKPGKSLPKYHRDLYRYWRRGDSYKMEMFGYKDPKKVEPHRYSAIAENAEERIGRNASMYTDRDGEKHKSGQVVFPHESNIEDFFLFFPSPDWLYNSGSQQRFFQYLIESKDKFEIKALISKDKVQLTIPWRGDKQVFLLDPKKGFLLIGFEAKMEFPATEKRDAIVIETEFEVEESRLFDGVWMPVKMTRHVIRNGKIENVVATDIVRSEVGRVKPADLLLPFTEGTQVQDILEGITYTSNAKGWATKIKDSPGWKREPPKGWRKGKVDKAYSLASKISDEKRKKLEAFREAKSKPIDEALAVLKADPPASQDQRIEAALKMFRAYKISEREDDWAIAIRELITIGKPAVPRLIAELDKTNRNKTLRALGFVLRGIDDPRAIPALIRAIPRLIQPSSSDYGLEIKNDPELLRFMWKHDNKHIYKEDPPRPRNGLILFGYGRPIREIMPALQKLTGKSLNWRRLNFADGKADGINRLRDQRTLFLNHAKRWVDWWSKNWQNFVDNEADAQLELTEKSLQQFAQTIAKMSRLSIPTKIPCGPKVKVGEGTNNPSFQRYLDLDVRSKAPMPKDLFKKSPKDKPSAKLLAWARRNGIDLLRIEIKRPDDEKTYYGYHPVDMKVWKIDNRRLKNLEKELQESKELTLPLLWDGPISSVDKMEGEMNMEHSASFLFITKKGTCGVFRIQSGMPSPPSGAPLMSPGALSYYFIYQSLEEPSKIDAKEPESWEISKRFDPTVLRYRFREYESLLEPIRVPAVKGVVVDPSGNLLPNIIVVSYTPRHWVRVLRDGNLKAHQHGPITKTNSKGEFRIPERKEPYRVLVANEHGIASLTHEELIHAKGRITLKPWAKIEGSFILDGKPQANKKILFYPNILPWSYSKFGPRLSFENYATTDKNGRFVMEHVPPLGGRLYGSDDGRLSNGKAFICEPGKTTHVELGLGRTLVGKLQVRSKDEKDVPIDWTGGITAQRAPLPLPVPSNIAKTDTKAVDQWFEKWKKTTAGQAHSDENYYRMNLNYYGVVKSDGSLRLVGVPAGKYVLSISTKKKHKFQKKEITINSDKGPPIDLGTISPVN